DGAARRPRLRAGNAVAHPAAGSDQAVGRKSAAPSADQRREVSDVAEDAALFRPTAHRPFLVGAGLVPAPRRGPAPPLLAARSGAAARCGDAVNGAILVLLRGIAADPDCTEDRALGRADEDAAGGRDHATLRELAERGKELRAARGPTRELAAAEAHAE